MGLKLITVCEGCTRSTAQVLKHAVGIKRWEFLSYFLLSLQEEVTWTTPPARHTEGVNSFVCFLPC